MSNVIQQAFPSRLAHELSQMEARLTSPALHRPSDPFQVKADGEQLSIPYRIYTEPFPDSEIGRLPVHFIALAAAWFSRHNDGRVRERSLRAINSYEPEWILSYVVPLCGEYVLPILDLVWDRRDRFSSSTLASWLCQNSVFYATIRRRVVSYWNCYYRPETPDFSRYVGKRLIDFFDSHCNQTSIA